MVESESSSPTGDGARFFSSRKQHECTAIITDATNGGAKPVVCRIRCPLGLSITDLLSSECFGIIMNVYYTSWANNYICLAVEPYTKISLTQFNECDGS